MTQLAAFGVAFCDRLNVALEELSNVLNAARANGLSSDSTVVSAQAVYDDWAGFSVYVPFLGDACEKNAIEVASAAERVRSLLHAHGVDVPALHPDYVPPEEGLSGWIKYGGIALIAVVGIVSVAYITGQGVSLVRMFKPRRRLFRGYRRSRR